MTSSQPRQKVPINRIRSNRQCQVRNRCFSEPIRQQQPNIGFKKNAIQNDDLFRENIDYRDADEAEDNIDDISMDRVPINEVYSQGDYQDYSAWENEFEPLYSDYRSANTYRGNVRANGDVRFSTQEFRPYSPSANVGRGVFFSKRQLPQLQRYQNGLSDERNIDEYFDDINGYQLQKKKSKFALSFPEMWQKFVITFTSLLSIICLTWVAYNWKTTNSESSIPEIKPEKPTFKVLPDAPSNVDMTYDNRAVYSRVDPDIQSKYNERLMFPTENPGELPLSSGGNNSTADARNSTPVYTIIDDRDYYIKCQKNSDISIAKGQINLIRKKLSSYHNPDVLANVSCSIRKVSNAQGGLGEYILIGPFSNETTAMSIGKFCQINSGEIISVQKKGH